MGAQPQSSPTVSRSSGALRAVLEIEPAGRAACPVVDGVPEAVAVSQSLSRCPEGQRCQTEVTVRADERAEHRFVSTDVSDRACICRTVESHECVFEIQSIESDRMVASVVLDSRAILSSVVADLRALGAAVRLRRIGRLNGNNGTDSTQTIEVDVGSVTEKQREAVELAIEMGYYEEPRRATLGDLADRLDISKSAVSQRLNAAEATVVSSLVESS